ncbi:hypothetical protein ONR57_17735 [Hoyosella sp. YIM 151337]|uniref:hypothetical protein n=1 Tax=Hoyosella sp. YIM 151337 TaxID=2992742 RepID=UPI002235A185|nr:hypothetical protein [Hoyosella sp. YIM 151337]MCW4355151.1 hypothetical protein [Hoyosella sp. YIM 151337]
MELSARVLDRAAAACRRQLGSPDLWPDSREFSHSLALCVIDAVQATAGHYPTTVSITERYCAYRRSQGVHRLDDGVRALLRTFEEAGTSHAWAGKVATYKRRHESPAQRVKARSIGRAADALYSLRVDSIADFTALYRHAETRGLLVRAWRSVTSHGFAANWDYLLTLTGLIRAESAWCLDNCTPFLREILGMHDTAVDSTEISGVLDQIAGRLGVTSPDLILAMRRWSAGRRTLLEPVVAAIIAHDEAPIAIN